MTESEFLEQWPTFLDAFSKAFDTPEMRQHIQEQVNQEFPDASYEEKLNAFTDAYQTARTENLIKAVVQNFGVFDNDK